MIGEEILLEIDSTLDQLIQNAKTVESIDLKTLSEVELNAFNHTQESLLHRLLHLDQHLKAKQVQLKRAHPQCAQKQIEEKKARFEQLNAVYQMSLRKNTRPKTRMLSKRRAKRLLSIHLI